MLPQWYVNAGRKCTCHPSSLVLLYVSSTRPRSDRQYGQRGKQRIVHNAMQSMYHHHNALSAGEVQKDWQQAVQIGVRGKVRIHFSVVDGCGK